MRTASAHTISGRRLGNIPALDGLRALAALAVVGFHAHVPGFANGDIGVDVFFVLSGFLITSILISRAGPRSFEFRDFYRRRALRLLPAYIAVVCACVILELFADHGGTFAGAASSSVYLANWLVGVTGNGMGTLGHTWSLSIEEQFYVVWPALLAFLLVRTGRNAKAVMWVVAGMLMVSWLMTAGLALGGVSTVFVDNATFTRGVELLFGCLLGLYVAAPGLSGTLGRWDTRSAGARGGLVAALLLIGLVVLSGTSERLNCIVGWPLISILTCAVIYACLRGARPVTMPLSTRAMTAIGKRSYGLYLWHFPILVAIDVHWGLESWTARAAGLAVTAVVVMVSYRFIERPFLARKDSRPGHGLTPMSVPSLATFSPREPPASAKPA